MPINDKQRHFIREYTTNGHNASKAYKEAYPDCNVGWDRLGSRLMRNDELRAEIDRVLTEDGQEAGFTRQDQRQRLLDSYDLAKKGSNPNAMTGAARALNTMLGYDTEPAVNQDSQRAILARMSNEDKELAQIAAKVRTEAEARKGLKLA